MVTKESPDPMSSMWAWLAHDLRFYRNKHKMTGTQLGSIIGAVRSTVSRLESGDLKIDEKQAMALDNAWNTGGHFMRLLTYAKLGHDPDWFKTHVQYERRAKAIKLFEALFIPGLLQTREYATALIAAGRDSDVEGHVDARLARQEILNRPAPPLLWVLLDQFVLERPVGGAEVMRAQLARLLEAWDLPNITIRVVPKSVGAHVGLDGSFKILSVHEGDVVYMDAQIGGRTALDSTAVQTLGIRYDRISAESLSRGSSRRLIEEAMETYQ